MHIFELADGLFALPADLTELRLSLNDGRSIPPVHQWRCASADRYFSLVRDGSHIRELKLQQLRPESFAFLAYDLHRLIDDGRRSDNRP
jgi:hypothetical protein